MYAFKIRVSFKWKLIDKTLHSVCDFKGTTEFPLSKENNSYNFSLI
jgi:hypothetical protein